MKLSQFRYYLPPELIAMRAIQNRDESKLMVIDRKTETIEHKSFKDIINYFSDGDVFVLNNTKVFPARLHGEKEKTGAKIEVFLLRELNKESRLWDVMVDPARKIRIGNKLYFGQDDELVAEIIDNTTSRGRTMRFLFDGTYEKFKETIQRLGETPLPKIIDRPLEPEDEERYQTIYAKHEGAIAAPSAGMHFSRELMKRLEIMGIVFAEVTLHAGMSNFRNIEVEDLSKHKMGSEELIINNDCIEIVNNAKRNKHQIVSVGTTSLKGLESSVTISGMLKEFNGWTNKFIFPPYTFTLPNAVVTNFHLPQSSMLMAVAAFAGYDFIFKAYKEAVEKKYSFYTYGDAMLIL